MFYYVRDVAICRVFAFYELQLSSTSVCGVFFEFAVRPDYVSDSPNDVWFVMGGYVLCWEDVFWDDVGGLCVEIFIFLEAFLFWLCNWGECGGGSVLCRGYVVTEVRDRLLS